VFKGLSCFSKKRVLYSGRYGWLQHMFRCKLFCTVPQTAKC